MQNGQVVKFQTRRYNGTNKKTKETSNGSTKSYTEETKTNKKTKKEKIICPIIQEKVLIAE